jgi:hypothetical protein
VLNPVDCNRLNIGNKSSEPLTSFLNNIRLTSIILAFPITLSPILLESSLSPVNASDVFVIYSKSLRIEFRVSKFFPLFSDDPFVISEIISKRLDLLTPSK